MTYPSIRIEGSILTSDILAKVEELPGQQPADFGLDANTQVKDEIARAWADAQDYWRIFQRKLEILKEGNNATTETRNNWVVPLLGLLGYELEYQSKGVEANDRSYPISHGAKNRVGFQVQIVGYRDPARLDKKPENATRRMSAHALVQEFLNLDEQLYGLVSDGHVLRLLRDSTRLVKLSYLEFDLDRIFTDSLFADFAVLYRVLHSTRMPQSPETSVESLIECYHQDSLESGARIRDGLSKAVEQSIREFADGFLAHPENDQLRELVKNNDKGKELEPEVYYQHILRLIYRLLFIMVIEERDLVFPPDSPKSHRDIYRDHYSVRRLRRLAERRWLADPRRQDLWLALLACFRLYEADGPGANLGIEPLAGELFSGDAIGPIAKCKLGNDVLLKCLRSLSLFHHRETNQMIAVNYAALNVEEFGSVYEGLLKYQPEFVPAGSGWRFELTRGDDDTQSHYTPDDLVQPLLRHSLDHLIEDCLRANNPEESLLDLRVADIACGSGHILLAAARRIATKLAVVRTGEEQPSPSAYRTALRDTIRTCVYGVDFNPLAVELCKVALWLEAHIPGQPINFLDHHIKCGNAVVGFAKRDELSVGVPTSAFTTMPDDDGHIATALRQKNTAELNNQEQESLNFGPDLEEHMDAVLEEWQSLSTMPESSPAEIDAKKQTYDAMTSGAHADIWRSIADIPVAQFYIPKILENEDVLLTDGDFRSYWRGKQSTHGKGVAEARLVGLKNRFFHWFLEFPEIMERGGFDCILGNPPYLGGQALSGTYGYPFCHCMKWRFAPAGLSELVVYFLRRNFELIREGGFSAILTTNSIIDGDVRKDGLEQVVTSGGNINMAVRNMRWTGAANITVSLLAVHKGEWAGLRMLDNQQVSSINTYFEEGEEIGEPHELDENKKKVFQGAIYLGDGFLLDNEEADTLCADDPRNHEVIVPIINGKELNNDPNHLPGRKIIDFQDWPIEKAKEYAEPFSIVEEKVKPDRQQQNRQAARDYWWRFLHPRMEMRSKIEKLPHCFCATRTTKHLSFTKLPTEYVFSNALTIFTTDRWDLFSIVQSSIHEVWARRYSGSLKSDLRYSPTDCFENFVFPEGLWDTPDPTLEQIGECYHTHRRESMQSAGLGLTKLYNLFHSQELKANTVAKQSNLNDLDDTTAATSIDGILRLRQLHVELDQAVLAAYGWTDLDLGHGFHEVDTLPENDRIRFTISPTARKELLNRLLVENHTRAEAEASNQSVTNNRRAAQRRNQDDAPDLFGQQQNDGSHQPGVN